MNSRTQSAKLSAREVSILAILAALIFAAKAALVSLPNINLNAVLMILATVYFGWKALYAVGAYVMLEGLVFGFSIWWFSYLYAWPLLVAAAMPIRKNRSSVIWAVFAGVYGILFGPLMYIGYFAIVGGWSGFPAMWIAGIPFDITHAVSNFLTVLVLFKPLSGVMDRFVSLPSSHGDLPQTENGFFPEESPMNCTISAAERKDLDGIAQLYYQNHISVYKGLLPDEYISKLSPDDCRAKWKEAIDDPEKRIWVAYQDEEFLGFAACMPDPKLPRTWYLESLHVTENARGKGIGSALIRTAGTYAQQNGYEKMSVCIVRGNDRAGSLYTGLGAEHYEFFEDSFLGSPSNSEKLIWNRIPHLP